MMNVEPYSALIVVGPQWSFGMLLGHAFTPSRDDPAEIRSCLAKLAAVRGSRPRHSVSGR